MTFPPVHFTEIQQRFAISFTGQLCPFFCNRMKLSILIPTFNYPTFPLAQALSSQGELSGIDYEILVADDASTNVEIRKDNHRIGTLPGCTYFELEKNVGRARIRNILADKAQGNLLLFIDCDALVVSPDFLKRYIGAASEAPVLCGGLRHPDTLPHPDVTLRYLYEKEADRHRAAKERSQHPYECFATFCFAIRRDIFLSIRFDENCQEYGYEDTLFGEELKRRSIPIFHFENPLIHIGLEDNATYLRKTETALRSLTNLQQRGIHFQSRLVSKYNQLRKYGVHRLLPLFFRLFSPLWRKNLLGKHPNLTVFAMYKLGYYSTIRHRV